MANGCPDCNFNFYRHNLPGLTAAVLPTLNQRLGRMLWFGKLDSDISPIPPEIFAGA